MELSVIDLQRREACGYACLNLEFEPDYKLRACIALSVCLHILSGLDMPIENADDAFVYDDGKRIVLGVQPEGKRPVDLFAFVPVAYGNALS